MRANLRRILHVETPAILPRNNRMFINAHRGLPLPNDDQFFLLCRRRFVARRDANMPEERRDGLRAYFVQRSCAEEIDLY